MYPIITIGEFPSRFLRVPADAGVDVKTVESWVTQGAHGRREDLWKLMERELARDLREGKFLLGTEHPTFLDLFVALVAHYTPHPRYALYCVSVPFIFMIGFARYTWLEQNCPRLYSNVKLTLQTNIVKDVFRENELDDLL